MWFILRFPCHSYSVSCCRCITRHYGGQGRGSVLRKTAMYTSVTVQQVKRLVTCPWDRSPPSRETDAMWWFVQLQVKRTTCSKEADLVHRVPHTNWYPWRRQQGTYSKHYIQGKRCDGKGQAPPVYPAEAVDENICYSSYVVTVCKRKRLKFANRTNDSVWETLAQRPKTACICTLFKAYTAERTGK